MSNIITGLIAVSIAVVFLLYYAYRLNSVALWVIIVGNLALLLFDFYKSIKEGEEQL